ncbi:MAG TPA: DUF427 domain-containing protein [Solirubrobacterales bacterium]|nr:DUF427 domain-containing protein [Solirubrobacterales bacterium]
MNPAEAREVDSSRYPPHLSEAGFMQPCPRRIRAVRGGATVLDTLRAFYVWEVPYYPAYYVPIDDVDPALLVLASTESFETGPFAGLVHVDWNAVDAWFEEDEEVFGGHPRSPYARVDAIRSSRQIRVEIDGVVVAESTAPVLLFETGLPTRHYIQRTDIDFSRLERTEKTTYCPYKGTTSDYWSARIGDVVHSDIAWSYAYPSAQVLQIAGLVAFYDERVDTFLDGVPASRPQTKFSADEDEL